MAEQERKTAKREKTSEEADPRSTSTAEKGERIKKGLDEVLEEIDAVLEQNAEEFVKNYIQRGGQ